MNADNAGRAEPGSCCSDCRHTEAFEGQACLFLHLSTVLALPSNSLYLVRFIEDTEGTFILRLGGELKVLDVLGNDLPVGDEVALGFHQQSRD